MNETLAGVLAGGLIAIITTWITLSFQNKQWRIEKKIEQLKLKRDRLEHLFAELVEHEKFGEDPFVDALYLYPDNVRKEYEKYLAAGNLNDDDKLMHEVNIQAAMKKALKEIDEQIEKEIK